MGLSRFSREVLTVANKGLSMRKVREVLRLHYAAGLSTRAIARSLKVSPATVGKYIRRAEVQGLSWPLPEPLDDAALERRLFPAPVLSATQRPLPQWSEVHRELRQQDVTLALLWQEYKAAHPEGLQYSWFCDQYRAWASKLDVVMRQEHRAGEKLFVDYAGRTVAVVDRHTGELRQAQVFVAVLGASNYTFAEATWTQALPDWIASHVRAFEFLGCSPFMCGFTPPLTRLQRTGHSRQLRLSGEPRPSLRARHQSDLPRPGPPLRSRGAPGARAKTSG